MNKLINQMEKMTPFFDKVAQNKYLKSVMNGFMGAMYIILFSSIFLIIETVPQAFGVVWSEQVTMFLKLPYNLTMGFLGFFIAGNIAIALLDDLNLAYKPQDRIDKISVFVASLVSYMLLVATFNPDGSMNIGDFGTTGLFVAIIVGIGTAHIFKFAKDKNLSIKLPEQVPPNVSESFKAVISFTLAVSFFLLLSILINITAGVPITTLIMYVLMPIFNVGNTYLGLFFIGISVSILTYIGIHGSSVVFGAIFPMILIAVGENQAMLAAGQVPNNAFAGFVNAILLGGSGATLSVCFMFAFMSKSKANKAIGKAAIIPTNFKINEPILFGAPILANPMFLIPYILVPGINGVIYKLFVDVLGMPGATLQLGLGFPDIVSLPLSHGLAIKSFILLIVLLLVDAILYYPFFKAYDTKRYKDELKNVGNEAEEKVISVEKLKENKDNINVLVLCMAGGTSGFLANAINKGAKELGLDILANANQVNGVDFGSIDHVDVIVLAPQARSAYNDLVEHTNRLNIKLVTTDGEKYIQLGQNPMLALDFIIENYKGE